MDNPRLLTEREQRLAILSEGGSVTERIAEAQDQKTAAQIEADTLRAVGEWLDDYDIGTNPEGDSVIFSIPLAAYEVMFGAALRAGQ